MKMTQVSNSVNNAAVISSSIVQVPFTALIDRFSITCSPINDTSAVMGLKSIKLDFNPTVAVLTPSTSNAFDLSLTIENIIPKQYRPNRLFQGPIFQVGQLIGGQWRDYAEFYCSVDPQGNIIIQNIGQLVISDLYSPEENVFYIPDLSILVSKRNI